MKWKVLKKWKLNNSDNSIERDDFDGSEEEDDFDSHNYSDDFTYDNYGGSYAQDTEGYSDQEIDDVGLRGRFAFETVKQSSSRRGDQMERNT